MSWHRLMPTTGKLLRRKRRDPGWQSMTCRGFALLFALLLVSCSSGGSSGGGSAADGGGSFGTNSERPTTGDLSLELAWDDSASNEDGSSLVDLAGYRVYDGSSSGNYQVVTDVGDTTAVILEDLPPGTYFIAVAAYDRAGNESQLSDEIIVELEQ